MNAMIDKARQAARAGQWREAEAQAQAILARDPQAIDALEIVALARRNAGDPAGAEAALRQAIAIAPERRWPYGDLARLHMDAGHPDAAEATARAALGADDANADAHMLLGRLLTDRGMTFEGAVHLRRAIALAGRHPELLSALGRALSQQGQLDEARKLLEESLRAMPDHLVTLCALAEVEERAGRLDTAAAWLDRAEPVARQAGTDIAHQRAVLLDRIGKTAEALAVIEAPASQSSAAMLLRGRLRDRLGQYEAAWRDWTEGKQRIASQTGRAYDAAAVARECEALLTLARAMPPAAPPSGDGGAQPIFILGFPRSGTTLTEQILSAHDQIRAGGELPFGPEMRELAGDFATLVPVKLRDHYLGRAAEYGLRDRGTRFFTDKMPLNEFHLPLIRLAFPQAKVFRVVRHPLDILVSVLSHDMTHGQYCGYRIDHAAQHLAFTQRQLTAYQAAGLTIDHVLRYEDLVADQEAQTTALMTALGLDLQPRQLAFHREPRHAPTPSYAQVHEPLNSRSIGRWRHFERELADVIPIVAETMAQLDYA